MLIYFNWTITIIIIAFIIIIFSILSLGPIFIAGREWFRNRSKN